MQNLHRFLDELGCIVLNQESYDTEHISDYTIARLKTLFSDHRFRFLVDMVIDYRGPHFPLPSDDDRDGWTKLYSVTKVVVERWYSAVSRDARDKNLVISNFLLAKFVE
jgi:hypothetical protein